MKQRTYVPAVLAALVAVAVLGSAAVAYAAKTSTATSSTTATGTPPPGGLRPGGGRGGPGGRGGMLGAGLHEVVSKLTGESTSTIEAARRSGKSLAEIAKAEGVTVDEVVGLALHAPKAALDSQVTDGLITRTLADTLLDEIEARLTEQVGSTEMRGVGGGPGPRGPEGRGPRSWDPSGTVVPQPQTY